MPRIRATGAVGVCTPNVSPEELNNLLKAEGCWLLAGELQRCYSEIGIIIGKYYATAGEVNVADVRKLLKRTAVELTAAVQCLEGLETGLRCSLEIAVTSRVIDALAERKSGLGRDKAHRVLRSFRDGARQVSEACLRANEDLARAVDKRGRKRKEWHDDFTRLCLSIAKKCGIAPSLHNRAGADRPGGNLLRLATALQKSLPREMRSPSEVALAQRLRRGLPRVRPQI